MGLALLAPTLLVTSLLGLIVVFVLREALPALGPASAQLLDLREAWFPLEGRFGLAPMVVASLLCAAGAVLLALPLGVASALFTQYYGRSWLARPYRWMIGLLAGIPSVVFGFWGLTVLVPLIARFAPPGASLIAGVLILMLMILPTIALTAEAALMAVPAPVLQGAHALGLGRGAIALRVLLPAARKGLVAGVVLAAARALGETMAVLMVTGNVVQMPAGFFDPVRTLTANIALEMAYATDLHRASLFYSGLVLTGVVVALALLAHRYGNAHDRS